MKVIIGTRGSALALWQANWVAQQLRAHHPHIEIIIRTITTKGDKHTDTPLQQIGDKGLFTREIEAALIGGEIHCAVHSLKDLPISDVIASEAKQSPMLNTEIASSRSFDFALLHSGSLLAMTDGLILAAITERADARDVLISRHNIGLDRLPRGARIGTSSLRRAAQLRAYRPDLQIVNLRGNVDTRLRKASSDEYDAIVLAAAGVLRLGHAERITEFLPFEVMLPAPGQGALAIQVRADDATTRALLAPLDHAPTRVATTAERAFLRALGGGCQVPVAAYGEVNGETLHLRGLIASEDGTHVKRGEVRGAMTQAEALGEKLATMLKQ